MMYYFLNFITFGLYKQFLLSGATFHFQSPGSLTFDRMIDFHDFVMLYLVFIFTLFVWCLVCSINIFPLFKYIFCFNLFVHFFISCATFLYRWVLSSDFDPKTVTIPIIESKIEQFKRSFLRYILKNRRLPTFKYIPLRITFRSSIRGIFARIKEKWRFSMLRWYFRIGFRLYNMENRTVFFVARRATHAPKLEIFWTVAPAFILLAIAIPSLYLLYMLDAVAPISLAVKVIGHQWYWSYEIGSPLSTSIATSFDSYMLVDSNIRLLEVDNVLFVPAGIPLTFFITSTDVIHSWAVPSLGIKVDAIPGRLNQVCVTVVDVNVYRGQCSELCGINHGFMPINVVSIVDRIRWFWR